MKAWILEKQARVEEKPLTLQEVPTPQPAAGEIRLKVHASGVCRTDIHVTEGDLPLRKSPLILGHQVAGVVDKVGEGVNRVQNRRAGGCHLAQLLLRQLQVLPLREGKPLSPGKIHRLDRGRGTC